MIALGRYEHPPKRTDIDRAAVLALRAQGLTYRAIGARCGISHMTARAICRKALQA
jgi:DNA-directed RNA polymerase specialized sigma24 family protein